MALLKLLLVVAISQALSAKLLSTEHGHLKVEAPHHLHVRVGQEVDRHTLDGIGALSAGASSRLLQDYPEKERSEILDLLFKPQWGASLQVLKVEIGGDMQSTDGSEPSHMRFRDETPNCTRGYESWLLKEAKARNPKIRTYGLAWGVPGWIGNGKFFSQDNIHYHVSWLQCIKQTYKFEIDYLGIWNEMPWGATWYVFELSKQIEEAGLSTKLVLLDAVRGVDKGFLSEYSTNDTFRNLVSAVGLHYPCENSRALSDVLGPYAATKFWASEELSTVADWGGAGCWGRMINQNFVRMNATSSIAWSLIWSAYPNLECFGNGLLYAFQPWDGKYEVMPPVWATAHTTQFTEAGWLYLPTGQGSGSLPEGGTIVTLASPELDEFTIVMETLTGQCYYHSGCFHAHEAQRPQHLRFALDHTLAEIARRKGPLQLWVTTAKEWFRSYEPLNVSVDGVFEIVVPVDAILTVTTVKGGSRAGAEIGMNASQDEKEIEAYDASKGLMPLPLEQDFDGVAVSRSPPFFADQGGAFEVIDAFDSTSNRVLEQQVTLAPIAWSGASPDPFTLVGGVDWTDVDLEVSVSFGVYDNSGPLALPVHVGVCGRVLRYSFFGNSKSLPEGYCLELIDVPRPEWRLTVSGEPLKFGALSKEAAAEASDGGWINLRLKIQAARIQAFVDGQLVANVIETSLPFGQVALTCGYHRCKYDNLLVDELEPLEKQSLEQDFPLLRKINSVRFDYHARSCDPSPKMPKKREDFTGFVGFAFSISEPMILESMGRLSVASARPLASVHNITLLECSKPSLSCSTSDLSSFASIALPFQGLNQEGVYETDDGWIYASLDQPVQLNVGRTYILMSSELQGADFFYDKALRAEPSTGVSVIGPAYYAGDGFHLSNEAPLIYGPINARLSLARTTHQAKEHTTTWDKTTTVSNETHGNQSNLTIVDGSEVEIQQTSNSEFSWVPSGIKDLFGWIFFSPHTTSTPFTTATSFSASTDYKSEVQRPMIHPQVPAQSALAAAIPKGSESENTKKLPDKVANAFPDTLAVQHNFWSFLFGANDPHTASFIAHHANQKSLDRESSLSTFHNLRTFTN